jgi:dipeptidyl aminopeptidase/acylaminoacyl peptidase
LCQFSAPVIEASTELDKRAPTIADSIQMTVLGDPLDLPDYPVAHFSPDREHFVVIARKGNLQTNSNDYSLLLFTTATVFKSSTPRCEVSFSSSTSQPGIANLLWINNSTLAFIGTQANAPSQIYSYSIESHTLLQRTRHNTDILSFVASPNFRTLAFFAQPPITDLIDHHDTDYGFRITNQYLYELLNGHISTYGPGFIHPYELFMQHRGKPETHVDLPSVFPVPDLHFSFSPDSKYLLFVSRPKALPEEWKNYPEIAGSPLNAYGYLLVNTSSLSSRFLINAPLSLKGPQPCKLLWFNHGTSVVLTATYMPRNVAPGLSETQRLTQLFVAEVHLDTHDVIPIVQGDFELLPQSKPNTISLRPYSRPAPKKASAISYKKVDQKWQATDPTLEESGIDIYIKEDMNTPPELMALDGNTQNEVLVFQPNRGFEHLAWSNVEEISWNTQEGVTFKGGLYLPPGYTKDKKYPLVIQTHGWRPNKFYLDGPSTAGFAAQALAAKDIIVVQAANVPSEYLSSTLEGPIAMHSYDALVDYLDHRELIDRKRVGLMGWSRSGFQVRYALTHSLFPYATAVIVDGMEASYFQYLMEVNEGEWGTRTYDHLNGAAPFGEGLQLWLKNAPGFNFDKVNCPIRMLALGPMSVSINMWETFAGLTRLGKPVDFIYLPNALHSPVKPSERLTVQQGDVDWFRFWLKQEEDPDPAKRDQYTRWRSFRVEQPKIPSQAETVQ